MLSKEPQAVNTSNRKPTGDLTTRTAWICLVCALVLQGLLFRQFCLREIVPLFPRGYDQAQYLEIAYDLYETIRDGGFRQGLASLRQVDVPQGVMLEAEAALTQFLEGPGRLAALDVNFAHLVLFEIVLLATACWLGRPALGLALSGLVL